MNFLPLDFRNLGRLAAATVVALPALISTPVSAAEFASGDFAAIPVQSNGRIQPVDTLARNSLLMLRQKQTAAFSSVETAFFTTKPSAWTEADRTKFRAEKLPVDDKTVTDALELRPVAISGGSLPAGLWLTEIAFRPWIARHFRVFRIDNEEVMALAGVPAGQRNHFSWAEIEPADLRLTEAANAADKKEAGARSPFENGVLKLFYATRRHHMLATSTFVPGDLPAHIPPIREYWSWLGILSEASQKLSAGKKPGEAGKLDPQVEESLTALITRYREFYAESSVGIVPPRTEDELQSGKWANLGGALLDVTQGQPIDNPPVLPRYAELAEAYRKGDDIAANTKLKEIAALYTDGVAGYSEAKTKGEVIFNRTQPFYLGICLYAVAALAVLVGWIASRRLPLRIAEGVTATGFVIHTVGLVARMWIQGRPPVTNLYSSAVFVGWGAVVIALIVERFWKNGVGSVVAAVVGFSTLLIAHQLGASGEDTIEMMRAVLDSNFWLATHVVVITFGYSAMFVAGALAAACLIRRVTDRSFTEESARNVTRAAYGALCFATFASFVGTMLGGIWADQSWGRFWGWDPKENGAILIVLWCALALHARLGGIVGKTGFLQLLVFGNIVTAWSWFGTNMLGIGLHSYGFTDAAFVSLISFVLSQIVIIALGWLPVRTGKSSVDTIPGDEVIQDAR